MNEHDEQTIEVAAPKGGLQIIAAPAGGWCEPDTGVCHLDPPDPVSDAEALDETDAPGPAGR
ncbi:hypothetical protein ACPXB3_02495 [Gordonia sp. DT219]|uniref:hypothetical protein n=1 Tax=Gordonia sp. DT219 TaxID=3416658 RepID=UPI003CF3543D